MSDVMLLGVLRMPIGEEPDPLTLIQFVDRARQAADRIESDAAEIDRLRAEVANIKEVEFPNRVKKVADAWKGKVERLEAEVAALREDAERYRLLRRGQKWSVIDGIGETLRADSLDAAIDNARKA